MSNSVPRNVSLDEETKAIVDDLVRERHFGSNGFSLALRTIIREWAEARRVRRFTPVDLSFPVDLTSFVRDEDES